MGSENFGGQGVIEGIFPEDARVLRAKNDLGEMRGELRGYLDQIAFVPRQSFGGGNGITEKVLVRKGREEN